MQKYLSHWWSIKESVISLIKVEENKSLNNKLANFFQRKAAKQALRVIWWE